MFNKLYAVSTMLLPAREQQFVHLMSDIVGFSAELSPQCVMNAQELITVLHHLESARCVTHENTVVYEVGILQELKDASDVRALALKERHKLNPNDLIAITAFMNKQLEHA